MISLNDRHPTPKAPESYRIRKDAMDAAVFSIGPHARHGFEYETWKCDGRWHWKLASVDERQPTAAMIKADGGKRAFLALSNHSGPGRTSPCHGVPSHSVPSHTTALHTGSRLDKPAAPSLIAMAAMIDQKGTAMASTEGNTIMPATNGLDIEPHDDLNIPDFLKRGDPNCTARVLSPGEQRKVVEALRAETGPKPEKAAKAEPRRIHALTKAAVRTNGEVEEAVRQKSLKRKAARGKAVDATSAAPVSDSPKAAKRASKAEKKTAGPPKGQSKTALVGELLSRKEGCTTADILALTGWPSVSVPAQAKAVGLTLRKEKQDGVTRYWGTAT